MTDKITALAVRYGVSIVADRITEGGEILLFEEEWDADSIRTPSEPLPLLRDHNQREPVGMMHDYRSGAEGLVMAGRLVGGRAHREHTVELVRGGLRKEVSIGFLSSKEDVWLTPKRRDGLARVLRRGVTAIELSLVYRGAIAGSRVLDLVSVEDPPPAPPALQTTGLGARSLEALAEARARVMSGYGGERILARRAEADAIFEAVDSNAIRTARERIERDAAERLFVPTPTPTDPLRELSDDALRSEHYRLSGIMTRALRGNVPIDHLLGEASRIRAELRRRGLD